jgi:5-formyltetrahydrofolate cyclo-ligase
MNSAELKRAKRDVRRRVLAERDAIPATARARSSLAIAQRFLDLPEVAAARTVLAFWSFGSELSTTPLIERLHGDGTRVAMPRIVDGELEAADYRPGDPVIETSFGAFEPAAGAAIDPAAIDVVAVPAVAFDREGGRVGYGGGFYDRFLPRTRTDAARIGVAFGVQLLAPGTTLPAGHFDLHVDLVVTESEVVRCRPTA